MLNWNEENAVSNFKAISLEPFLEVNPVTNVSDSLLEIVAICHVCRVDLTNNNSVFADPFHRRSE